MTSADVWAPQNSNPIEDLQRCVDIIKRQPPRPVLHVVEVPEWCLPYDAPRLERERFSGGVNLSAQSRNAARVVAARDAQQTRYIVDTLSGLVWCSPRGAAELRRRCEAASVPAPEYAAPVSFTISDRDFEMPRLDLASGYADRVRAYHLKLVDSLAFHQMKVF
jgi:hypothetical protein